MLCITAHFGIKVMSAKYRANTNTDTFNLYSELNHQFANSEQTLMTTVIFTFCDFLFV